MKKGIAKLAKKCYNFFTRRKGGSHMNTFGQVDSVDFAIYLNEKAKIKGFSPNVTKIHKWLYACYGASLALNDEQLLDERPKAWDYGPAFPRVHKKQKRNNNTLDGLSYKTPLDELQKHDAIIDVVLDHFGSWTASELVHWTHEPGKAWHKKFNSNSKYQNLDNLDITIDFKRYVANGV